MEPYLNNLTILEHLVDIAITQFENQPSVITIIEKFKFTDSGLIDIFKETSDLNGITTNTF